MIEPGNLWQLQTTIGIMQKGQRLDLGGVFASWFPNPPYQREDDHLEPKERGERWAKNRGCSIVEIFDRPGLRLEKL